MSAVCAITFVKQHPLQIIPDGFAGLAVGITDVLAHVELERDLDDSFAFLTLVVLVFFLEIEDKAHKGEVQDGRKGHDLGESIDIARLGTALADVAVVTCQRLFLDDHLEQLAQRFVGLLDSVVSH